MFDIFFAAVATVVVASTGAVTDHPASCTQQFRAPIIVQPATADYPAIAKLQGVTGTSLVRVDLNESGRLQHVFVAKTSGNRWLDQAALRAVSDIAFRPEVQDCRSVAGSYAIEVTFER